MNAVATIQPSRMQIPPAIAKEFEIQAADWRVLVEQIFPAAKSVEAVMMALAYCRRRNLDIFKKPVHIVPMWSSAKKTMVETVWPGIAEIRTTASRTGQYAGIDAVEFGPMIERVFHGERDTWDRGQKTGTEKFSKTVKFPESASVVVYRMVGGEKGAYHAKVYWEETYATVGKSEVPNDMWAKRPRGQLDKCVEAAALRKAFPEELGNTYAAEEMEGRTIEGTTVEHAPAPTPPVPPKPPAPPAERKKADVVDAEIIDPNTGEVLDSSEVVTETTREATDAVIDESGTEGADYFTRLSSALAATTNATEIAEVWTEFDPLSKFEGDDEAQAAALSMKREHVKRVGHEHVNRVVGAK